MLRILYYNWAPLSENEGGGVRVYLNNLLNYIIAHKSELNIEPVFLSSGYYYDKRKEVYLKEDHYKGIRSYAIVNSPVVAPLSVISNDEFAGVITDCSTVKIFEKFLIEKGPFDIVHFQSFEGLSPNVLSLRQKFQNLKFIHTMHDYGCFCSNVRFWTNKNENCVTHHQCENCFLCRTSNTLMSEIVRVSRGETSKLRSIIYRVLRKCIRSFPVFISKKQDNYRAYRNCLVDKVNRYIDIDLSVSKRVMEIAELYGIRKEKLRLNYIGTKVAENSKMRNAYEFDGKTLTILYIGYASIEKGFFYLLDSLEKLNGDLTSNIVLKFATRIDNKKIGDRINNLKEKYKDVIVYNGYSHDDLPEIFKDVNIGVVPPLWEDNLPQVAIEMVSGGIPVMTSSNGGAKELNSHPDFIFFSQHDLIDKLNKIYNTPSLLLDYWNYSSRLTTFDCHIKQLLEYYSS